MQSFATETYAFPSLPFPTRMHLSYPQRELAPCFKSHKPDREQTTLSLSRKRRVAVSQISLREAADLIEKLLSERVPLRGFFVSPSGTRIVLPGFVDSATSEHGLVISVSGPPLDASKGWMNVRPFDRECEFEYGEKRELPEEIQSLSETYGESCLVIRFLDCGELFVLFFTL